MQQVAPRLEPRCPQAQLPLHVGFHSAQQARISGQPAPEANAQVHG